MDYRAGHRLGPGMDDAPLLATEGVPAAGGTTGGRGPCAAAARNGGHASGANPWIP